MAHRGLSAGMVDVTNVGDIRKAARDLGTRDAERIRSILNDDPDAVVWWLPEWLADEKDLGYAEGTGQVAVGTVDAETDKAWCIGQPGLEDGVWVPKSQAEMFEAAGDGVESKQDTLI